MFELIKEMNWNLLGTLIIVSSLVAWVGDVVGMKLGKKRITFLNLRPKHTSRIISIMTGIGIAIFTLFVISIASEPVRTALFSMNYVQNQITSLTAELQKNRSSLQGMEVELFASKGDLEDKQVELLISSTQLNVGAHRDGVVPLNQRIQEFVNRDWPAGPVSLRKIVSFKHAGNGVLRCQLNQSRGWHRRHPS